MINQMTKEEFYEYSKEWEEWSSQQGAWPYTPEDPLLDQSPTYTENTQPSLHKMVTQTVQTGMHSRSDQSQ